MKNVRNVALRLTAQLKNIFTENMKQFRKQIKIPLVYTISQIGNVFFFLQSISEVDNSCKNNPYNRDFFKFVYPRMKYFA